MEYSRLLKLIDEFEKVRDTVDPSRSDYRDRLKKTLRCTDDELSYLLHEVYGID